MTDKEKIRNEVERLRSLHQIKYQQLDTDSSMSLVECGKRNLCNELLRFIDSLQEEPVSVWHNASEEPNDMSHCLIFYGCKESVGHYLHYEPVLYNKKEKMFVTSSLPHPTGYKRDRISISDITQWCYLCDLHNLSNVERTVKDWKEEPVSEDLEINIEKFICDCIEKAERSVTWEYIDENIDGHIFKGALREQGLEYKNGKIVKIGEEPKEAEKKLFLIYDMGNDKFEATSDEPELKGDDIFCPVVGTPYLIRLSDYQAHLSHDIATKFLKKGDKDE